MQHEELIISAASKTSVTGAAAGVVGTVSQFDILTLTGVLIAVAGFGVNLFLTGVVIGVSIASIWRGWNQSGITAMRAGIKLPAAALGTLLGVLAAFEGRSLIAYVDPVGIPTICEGWTHSD